MDKRICESCAPADSVRTPEPSTKTPLSITPCVASLLVLVHSLVGFSHVRGDISLLQHVEDPSVSPFFSGSALGTDHPHLMRFVLDTLRMVITSAIDPAEIRALMAADLATAGWKVEDRVLGEATARAINAWLTGARPAECVEVARRGLPLAIRPTYTAASELVAALDDPSHVLLPWKESGEDPEESVRILIAFWGDLDDRNLARTLDSVDAWELVEALPNLPAEMRERALAVASPAVHEILGKEHPTYGRPRADWRWAAVTLRYQTERLMERGAVRPQID